MIVVSLTMIFFVIALVYTESRTQLFKLMVKVPKTKERKLSQKLQNELENLQVKMMYCESCNLKKALRNIEFYAMQEALKQANGNQARAAAILNMPTSTFNQKLRQIDKQDVDQC